MRINTLILMLLVAVEMLAVRPRKPMMTVRQSDGVELTLQNVADGIIGYTQTVDGYVEAENQDGDYCYVRGVENGEYVCSELLAHNPSDRTAEEMTIVRTMLRGNDLLGVALRTNTRTSMVTRVGTRDTAPLTSMGSPKVPVILVQFADLDFISAESDSAVNVLFDKYCNGTNDGQNYTGAGSYGAVKDYFIAQSDSLFSPEFSVIGPVTLDSSYVYYGKDASYNKDVNINKFFSEAILKAQLITTDWSDFDNDGDGVIDMAFFIYAGEGQNGCDDANTIWPKEMPSGGNINGLRYGAYACCNETYKGTIDGIGTMVHELSHALGLPDFYDYNYSAFGMDYWDVMDSGNYCAGGKIPCGYSAYEKDFMGWKPLTVLKADSAQIGLILKPLSKGGGGYKIVNQKNEDEYYVLDNRQNTGWDKNVGYSTSKFGFYHGMLVTHVDYLPASWTSNRVNSNSNHQRFTLIPADGELLSSMDGLNELYLTSMGGDPYPGLTNTTSLEGENAKVYTGGTMNQPITNIVEHEDGTITFDFCASDTVSNSISGVEALNSQVKVNGNTLTAVSPLYIYNVSGALVARLEENESVLMPKGTYVIRFFDSAYAPLKMTW